MDESLFSVDKLSAEVVKRLPVGYVMRPLNRWDFDHKILETYSQLTQVGQVTQQSFHEWFDFMRSRSDEYFCIVILEPSTLDVVACGTVLVERKCIRSCGKVGHIEDIVVNATQRRKNFGKIVIDQLTHLAQSHGCYKVILCCDDKNVGFYEKCGYTKKEVEMVKYF